MGVVFLVLFDVLVGVVVLFGVFVIVCVLF